MWPESPLPHPPALRPLVYVLHPSGAFIPRADLTQLRGPLPPSWDELVATTAALPEYGTPSGRYDEVYLQLGALDLDNDEAIVEFVNEFEVMNVRGDWMEPFSWDQDHKPRIAFPLLSAYPGFDGDDLFDLTEPLRTSVERAESACGLPYGVRETIEEFRWGARCVRDLTTAWRCLRDELPPSEAQWENPLIKYSFEGPATDRWWDDAEMADFIAETLKAALISLSPRMVVDHDDPPLPLAENFSTGLSLFAVSCLELFNHIVEDAPYRTCANDRCGRLFVRQQGRAVHGQRRTTGVRYCSAYCARSVAQRSYRERQKSGRALEK
jgi:hypothetical protein